MTSPKIDHYSFGQITLDGKHYTRDVIIYPHVVECNWWRADGHCLTPQDLSGVFAAPPEVLVIGQGSLSRMRVPEATRQELAAAGIEVIAQSTTDACETYNRLRQSKRVVVALHLTC